MHTHQPCYKISPKDHLDLIPIKDQKEWLDLKDLQTPLINFTI